MSMIRYGGVTVAGRRAGARRESKLQLISVSLTHMTELYKINVRIVWPGQPLERPLSSPQEATVGRYVSTSNFNKLGNLHQWLFIFSLHNHVSAPPSMSDGTSAAGPGPWWVVVTGASQGLGAAICTCLAPLLPPGSKLLGMARSQQGLDSTVASVKAINPKVTVSGRRMS